MPCEQFLTRDILRKAREESRMEKFEAAENIEVEGLGQFIFLLLKTKRFKNVISAIF